MASMVSTPVVLIPLSGRAAGSTKGLRSPLSLMNRKLLAHRIEQARSRETMKPGVGAGSARGAPAWVVVMMGSEPEKIGEERDQRLVRWGHGIGAQVPRPYPFQGLPLQGLHEALPAAADIERHEKMEGLVGVAGEGE